ncbi:class I SAM-dependent methyltransferase [Dokdonella sp.]|uniref:class I SAM-dependent methyltransferase n=1 Tax=Dokdonella sp. TaxID=2291710 RepID=UPI0031C6AE9E|nr:class I SAM-dependent methyltransferase [Dokdonella sp.]
MSEKELPFTGERFTPECVREIWYEHWHRYAFARPLAAGRRVLDAACGEGYGAAMLAAVASEVTGVDIDPATVEHARSRYAGVPHLRYEQGDAARLPFSDASFDLVVSFETLEHLAAQEALVAGFARVLADDGLLIISSPDKHVYSELAGFRNEFHVKELYREELLELLRPHFPHLRLYGQKLLFQSAVWALDQAGGPLAAITAAQHGERIQDGLAYAPMYFIAVCGKRPLPPALPALSLFGDAEESLYSHYNAEVRKNMAAGARIAELEAELERLHAATPAGPTKPRRWWRRKP